MRRRRRHKKRTESRRRCARHRRPRACASVTQTPRPPRPSRPGRRTSRLRRDGHDGGRVGDPDLRRASVWRPEAVAAAAGAVTDSWTRGRAPPYPPSTGRRRHVAAVSRGDPRPSRALWTRGKTVIFHSALTVQAQTFFSTRRTPEEMRETEEGTRKKSVVAERIKFRVIETFVVCETFNKFST